VIVCKPADPEAKGLVERFHDYLERSFLSGRDFAGPADFNTQLGQFLAVARTRLRRALGCPPADRIAADRQAMLGLPPVAPVTGWRSFTRLARDHYIRLDANDYSVHPAVIGRRIEITAGLNQVTVACEGRVVASHDRIWAWHQTITDPEHLAAARALRRDRITIVRPPREAEVQIRSLSDYDTALGLSPDGSVA
jgi:transposase